MGAAPGYAQEDRVIDTSHRLAGRAKDGEGLAGGTGQGREAVPPENPAQRQRLRARGAGAWQLARRNWLLCVALALAAVPRVIVMLGFRPAILVRLDSYIYLLDATRWIPDPDNTNGYPFLLWLLRPLHSLALVATLQHLLGLAAGVAVYAVVRRYGGASWLAVVAALPVLFDSRELLVEQAIMSDTLAMTLMLVAFALLLRGPGPAARPSLWRAAGVGALLGAASLVRPTVAPLIVLVAGYLLVARVGWRRAVAVLVAGAVPLAGYMAWFAASYGVFSLTSSSGLFLWSRTMSFANCQVIKPPPDLRPLCPDRNPGVTGKLAPAPSSWSTLLRQETPQDYLWDRRSWLWQPWPSTAYEPYQVAFTPARNKRAQQFALRAITAQPGSYALVVGEGTALTFLATNHDWQFPRRQPRSPSSPNGTYRYELGALRAYTGSEAGLAPYLGFYTGTRLAQPWAYLLGRYQRLAFLPGIVLALVFAGGLVLVLVRRRGMAVPALLWVSAAVELVLPIAVHQFNYRYALTAVPLATMAAAIAVVRRRDPAGPGPGQ